MDLQVVGAVHVDADVAIELRDRALDRFDAGADIGAAVRGAAAADRAGAGEMMIDLPPHGPRFAHDGFAEVVGLGGRGVHDDGQRRLERVGEVAGVAARFLGLASRCARSGR